jgi:iron complex transport system permease protein
MKRALLYLELLVILTAIFLIHNHTTGAYQPTSRGIGVMIIGAALGISSTLLQGFFRNTIADVGFMGIATAGALGSVTSIALGNEFGSRIGLFISVLFALAGYYAFGLIKNKFFTNGILLTLILSTPILLITQNKEHDGLFWILGSFTELNKLNVKHFAPFVEVGLITSFFVARKVLSNSNWVKFFVGIGTAFLIGSFVNVTGVIIGFGIFIPYLTQKLIKGDTRRILSYSALTGPILLLIIDMIVNHLNEISVTVITLLMALVLSWFSKKQAKSQK